MTGPFGIEIISKNGAISYPIENKARRKKGAPLYGKPRLYEPVSMRVVRDTGRRNIKGEKIVVGRDGISYPLDGNDSIPIVVRKGLNPISFTRRK